MRIWDVEPRILCRRHLLGEHRELHGLWNILTHGKKGYSLHPETVRWRGKLAALSARHDALVAEMVARGYRHGSPLPLPSDLGSEVQDVFVDSPARQLALLTEKPCPCPVHGRDDP